jgi:hypothetical protein
MPLKVDPIEDPAAPGCPCCSDSGLRGFVYEEETPHSVYFAESGGMSANPVVLIGIALGRWASDAPATERACFVFACSKSETGFSAKPTIPYLLSFPEFKQLGVAVEPADSQTHAMHGQVRETLDAIITQDRRLSHLRGGRQRFVAD